MRLLLIVFIFFFTQLKATSAEIKLTVTSGPGLTFTLTKLDNVYNAHYKNQGYSKNTSSAYNNVQTNDPKTIIYFDFFTDTDADFKILHSLYKLQRGSSYIKIDWRDCEYSYPYDPDLGNDPYNTHDLYLEYENGVFSVKNHTTGNFETVSNGATVKIWGNGRKCNSTHPNSCFGNPSAPTNLWHQKVDGSGGWQHPKLMWDVNNDFDIDGYQLWRKLHDESQYYSIADIDGKFNTQYIDTVVKIKGPNKKTARYKVRARDWGNNHGGFSNIRVVAYNSGLWKLNDPNEEQAIKNNIVTRELEFVLNPVSPNPFNPNTNISFSLPEPANINITVYNILGEAIDFIKLDNLAPGLQELQWSGVDAPSGMYLLYLEAFGINSGKIYHANSKMHLLK